MNIRNLAYTFTLTLFLAVSPFCNSEESRPNTLAQSEKEEGWVLLFDGKTPEGWRGYRREDMPPGWKVINGALVRVSGGEGGLGAGGGDDLITIEQYKNFELKLQWKISPGGNSGILYHVTEVTPASWRNAPEMQVLDNAAYVGRDPKQLAGALYDLYAAEKDVARSAGEWNRVRLRVNDGRVEHWLNGEKIVEYEIGSDEWKQRVANSKFKDLPHFAKAEAGHICLQDHSNRVSFRDIKLRPLE